MGIIVVIGLLILGVIFVGVEEDSATKTKTTSSPNSSGNTARSDKKSINKEFTYEDLVHTSPNDFEKLVENLYRSKGYSAMVTPGSGDYGVDVNVDPLDEDKHGAVQCKRYKKSNKVVPAKIREYGGLLMRNYDFVDIVTTSTFTEQARLESSYYDGLSLINGEELLQRLNENCEIIERQSKKGTFKYNCGDSGVLDLESDSVKQLEQLLKLFEVMDADNEEKLSIKDENLFEDEETTPLAREVIKLVSQLENIDKTSEKEEAIDRNVDELIDQHFDQFPSFDTDFDFMNISDLIEEGGKVNENLKSNIKKDLKERLKEKFNLD